MGDASSDGTPAVKLCAWTKRVERGGDWITIQEFLDRQFGITVTYGICPQAMRTLLMSE